MTPMRTCDKCFVEKPLDAENFRPTARGHFRRACRPCMHKQNNASRADRPGHEIPKPPVSETHRPPRINTPITPMATPAYVPSGGMPQRILVLFDLHWGDHDPAFWRCVIAWLGENAVNEVILAGDVMDLESASSHGGNADQPFFTEDVATAKEKLRELKKASGPDARISWLEGNHETRLGRLIAQFVPTLHGSLALPEVLGLAELGIDWVGEQSQPIRRGSLKILHGHQLSSPGQLVAKRLVDVYAGPGDTVACGHFHRPSSFVKPMHGGNARGLVLGCGRTLAPKWQHGAVNGWQQQFLVADVLPNGRTFTHVVDVLDGFALWGDRLYSGAA